MPVDWSVEAKRWKQIENLAFPPIKCPNAIEMIIGTFAFHVRSPVEVAGGEDDPVARRTPLGWTEGGRSDATTIEMKESTYYLSQIERSPASFINNKNDKFACSTIANPKVDCNCAEFMLLYLLVLRRRHKTYVSYALTYEHIAL